MRGEYLSKAAGCRGCHTEARDGAIPYAGGRELKTSFGTFYGPNITPHLGAGIGGWNEEQFRRSLRHGERPDGAHYFPAFPYPSFTLISDEDVRNLWAYLRTLAPSDRRSQEHQLRFPYRWRFLVGVWKALFFEERRFAPESVRSAEVNRGAYLVNALGHCGECHTPRNWLGAVDRSRWLAGTKLDGGGRAPNLTPTGLKKWTDGELEDVLKFGLTPEGDILGETMSEVIRNTTSQLTPQDLAALVAYLRSLPPIADEPG